MSPPSDIPRFRGDENLEDAEKWLETFITATGSFTESGIFRLLHRKLPAGSPAREWFDTLEETAKTSWMTFEQQFCERWLTESRRRNKEEAWSMFAHHNLADGAIFSGEDHDQESSQRVISAWVEDHLELGKGLDRGEDVLVETTRNLLPAFIQAYLQVYIKLRHQNIDELCSAINDIPDQILDMERTCRRISSMDRYFLVEKKIEEMSEKVDKLMVAMSEGGVLHPDGRILPSSSCTKYPKTDPRSGVKTDPPSESIDWEPCSPLTSVMSMGEPASSTTSELPTPVAQSIPLPNPPEEGVEQLNLLSPDEVNDTVIVNGSLGVNNETLFRVPLGWRKTANSKTKNELIAIAQEAIEFAINYGKGPSVDFCQSYYFSSAASICDRLVNSRLYITRDSTLPTFVPRSLNDAIKGYWNPSGYDGSYWDLLYGINIVHSYYSYRCYDKIKIVWERWLQILGSNDDSYPNLIKPDQTSIQKNRISHNLHLSSSGRPSLAGGVFEPESFSISSIRTVLLMTLSSYLAECTGDVTYTEIAIQLANCIKTWMMSDPTGLIKECRIDASNARESDGGSVSCHLTGAAIEGFSVLACVTRDDTWRSLAIDIARVAMQHAAWHSADGILSVGTDGAAKENTNTKAFKGMLNRGLMVAYERNRSNEPFCNLVRSYINVQFNALYDLSRFQNSYGVDWNGPYAGPYAHAQIAALDTLVAAISVNGS